MNNIQKGLIKMYWRGWNDSENNTTRFEYFEGKDLKAYEIGWYDYLNQDEVIEKEKTDKEILELVNKKIGLF